MDGLPYRGAFGAPRPPALDVLALPPGPMPSHQALRPLKAWRYVGIYGPEVMVCVGAVRIGPLRQSFWAVWDRARGRLHERTRPGRSRLRLATGAVQLDERTVQLDLRLEERAGIETVCRSGESYAWTRKQGDVRAQGTIAIEGRSQQIEARGVIDDTAAYYARHTSWRWSAGVGEAQDGRRVAWNLVSGVNDPPVDSERTVWVDGEPFEAGPSSFAEGLAGVDGLRFIAEAVRERNDNLLAVQSRYRQPFGVFSGQLPGGIELVAGYGVMEEHDVRW